MFLLFSGIMVQQGWGKIYVNNGSDTLGNDLFPLEKNLMYEYGFYFSSQSVRVSIIEQLHTDSGSVAFIVRDSQLVNDSTVEWIIEKQEKIYHDYWNFGEDTTYWTSDTSTGILTENLNGNHEISSSLGIWSFPLTQPRQSIFRYYPDSSIILKRSRVDSSFFSKTVDSIIFHRDIGMDERWTSYFSHPGISFFFRYSHLAASFASNWCPWRKE